MANFCANIVRSEESSPSCVLKIKNTFLHFETPEEDATFDGAVIARRASVPPSFRFSAEVATARPSKSALSLPWSCATGCGSGDEASTEADDDTNSLLSSNFSAKKAKRWADVTESDDEGEIQWNSMESLDSILESLEEPSCGSVVEKCTAKKVDETTLVTQSTDNEKKNDKIPVTTMMIRNIPCSCNAEDVLTDIDGHGFQGKYDFFYLPQQKKAKYFCVGYALINFFSEEDAAAFMLQMNGHCFSKKGKACGQKKCQIAPGKIQGREANLEIYLEAHNANNTKVTAMLSL